LWFRGDPAVGLTVAEIDFGDLRYELFFGDSARLLHDLEQRLTKQRQTIDLVTQPRGRPNGGLVGCEVVIDPVEPLIELPDLILLQEIPDHRPSKSSPWRQHTSCQAAASSNTGKDGRCAGCSWAV